MTTTQFKEIQFKHFKGESTPLFNITHLAFTSKNSVQVDTDDLSTNTSEVDRIAILNSEMTYNLNTSIFTIDLVIPNNKVVCPTSIITAQPSSTIITLTSSTFGAFKIGDLILLPTSSGDIETEIININSGLNQITVNNALSVTIGGLCKKKISYIAILCNSNNTPSPTDLIYKWLRNPFYKDSASTKPIKIQFKIKS